MHPREKNVPPNAQKCAFENLRKETPIFRISSSSTDAVVDHTLRPIRTRTVLAIQLSPMQTSTTIQFHDSGKPRYSVFWSTCWPPADATASFIDR
jgi:hypothetical protein